MITRRSLLIALGAGALAPRLSFAQQPAAKVWRIGFLGASTAASFAARLETLRTALRELGYEAGRNVNYELRWADNELGRLPDLAGELVRAKCDVIVTSGTPAILALKRATTAIPIVMASSGDAIKYGLVASMARPGGNVTGLSFFAPELYAKRLSLIKEALPRVKSIAYLVNPDNPVTRLGGYASLGETAARQLKVTVHMMETRNLNEIEAVFASTAAPRVDAVVIGNDSLFITHQKKIAALATRRGMASIGVVEFAADGGLIGFGQNSLDLYRRSAVFVDKILKGANPANLPIEQPTAFETELNMKTAKALGIKFPQSILVQATRVIE